ncbi:MFS general substrate transporter [Mycena leptocephala]|nr:MFS general substrate transporter [Mycena leptocephala]
MERLSEIPAPLAYDMTTHELRPVVSDHELDKKEVDGDVEVSSPVDVDDDFPDGGFRALGYISSWAVFQAYYQQVILPHSSPSEIAWIGSIQRCIQSLPGVLLGRLFDLGFFRAPFAIGSVLVIVGTFLIPVCKVYWHFLLCQGFMIGVGCGLTYVPVAPVITHWWKKRRGLALGLAACGSAAGGVFFPIAMRQILPVLGFAWTIRIMGFILIFALGMANLCLSRRLPPRKLDRSLLGLHVFRSAPFSVYTLSCFLAPFGAFTVASYIASTALAHGHSRNFALYLPAMNNGVFLFGAIVFGFIGDLLGAMNVLIQVYIAITVITMIWPYCSTVASLCVISVLHGFVTGAFPALSFVPVAAMGGTEDLGRRMGMVNTVVAIGGLCGPPLGGLLVSTSLGYKAVGYFAGGMLVLGGLLFALARYLAVPRLWAKF